MTRWNGPDRPLIIVVTLLLGFGLLILYSAGITDAPTNAAGAWRRQLVWVGGGVLVAFAAFRTSPRLLEWAAPWLYGLSLVLLALVLVIGTGAGSAASSKSWLAIGGIRIGQPVELAKLATVLLLARYLSARREPPYSLRDLLTPCLIAGAPLLLVMAQPDLGSAIVFVAVLFAALFWAGVRPALLLFLVSPLVSLLLAVDTRLWAIWMLLLAGLLLLWRAFVFEGVMVYLVNSAMGVLAIMVWDRLKPYQQLRLSTFLNPELDPARAGYQAIQSMVAVGSGGLTGNGFTEGPQKRLAFLPEQHTDFIFSVVGEELGFLGVTVALGLFLALFLILLRIARRATDTFGGLTVFGILGLLFAHVFENIGMTVNVMPITGIPLPFFSYGGSFLLANAIAIGLVLRVAWESRRAGYAD
jgi:rod shape determining protein RodA